MNKVRSDALWNELSAEQRVTLAEWLFDDRLSYEAACERAQNELGFRGSVSSLRRFYKRTAQERLMEGFGESVADVQEIEGAEISVERLRDAGLKVVAQLFLQQVVSAPEKAKEWGGLAKLLLQSQANEDRLKVKREELALRREELNFERLAWEYDTARGMVKVWDEIPACQKALDGIDEFEDNRQLNDFRRKLFGPNLSELQPESQAEKDAMEKAREKG
jgi:hypothetical protein